MPSAATPASLPPTAAFPTAVSDSPSPAAVSGREQVRYWSWKQNLSQKQQGEAFIPLSQQHRDFHEDLVWVGATRSNQRVIPRRSNMKNSLITMSFELVCPWIAKQNNCIYPGKHNALADALNNQCCPTITTQSIRISISANKR